MWWKIWTNEGDQYSCEKHSLGFSVNSETSAHYQYLIKVFFKKLWSEMTFLNFWKILKNCFFDTTYKIGFLAWSLITHYCVTRRDCVSCTSHHYFYHFNCWTFYSDKRRMYFAKIADSRVKLWWRTYSNRDVTFETLIYYPFKDG